VTTAQQRIADTIVGLKTDPLGFVLYNFPWGEKGTVLEGKQLEDWQVQVLTELGTFLKDHEFRRANKMELPKFRKAVASGHGIGKSALVAMLVLFFMSTRKDCRGAIIANTGDQLTRTTWPELQKWHSLSVNKDWFQWSAEKFVCLLAETEQARANWRFDAATWSEEKTEAFQGLHSQSCTVVILDEASAIPDKIWAAGSGVFADPLVCWFAVGNPTRPMGKFHRCFGADRDLWKPQSVDSRTCRINAANHGEYKLQIAAEGEDSDYVRVRIKGQFPSASNKQFISTALVENAQDREIEYDPFAALIMGVDPARFGADQIVVRMRRGRDAKSIPPVKWRGLDTMDLANRISELIDKHDPDAVCIDAGGIGAALVDRLRQMGYRKIHEVWFGAKTPAESSYANMRAKLWGDIRDWLPGATIDKDKDLFSDLIGPEYSFSGRDGDQYILESVESMKLRGLHSPDDASALACTFAVKVARRDKRASRGAARAGQATGQDYDRFA
jgi:hypothetical protein